MESVTFGGKERHRLWINRNSKVMTAKDISLEKLRECVGSGIDNMVKQMNEGVPIMGAPALSVIK